eukprot:TRINITY_DN51988_c0_g1_i1.p1 TRINITY_DN51988_c0_g1~~TRINITY_DN51988_c0_g1_i1.p1  ORF type:complete len:450 (-),score=37.49 TRINITY_DN51988_c0_g1_i1:1298-2647(-)
MAAFTRSASEGSWVEPFGYGSREPSIDLMSLGHDFYPAGKITTKANLGAGYTQDVNRPWTPPPRADERELHYTAHPPGWANVLPNSTERQSWACKPRPATTGSDAGYCAAPTASAAPAEGLEGLQEKVFADFKETFPTGVVTETPVSDHVQDRFMAKWRSMYNSGGVQPRVLFHGTRKENLDAIYSQGLLPGNQTRGTNWYTDAVWTATSQRTSQGYSDCGVMFACAVLDPATATATADTTTKKSFNWDAVPSKTVASTTPLHLVKPEEPKQTKQDGETAYGRKKGKQQRQQQKLEAQDEKHDKERETSAETPSMRGPVVEHRGDWAVLVRDPANILPLFNCYFNSPASIDGVRRGHVTHDPPQAPAMKTAATTSAVPTRAQHLPDAFSNEVPIQQVLSEAHQYSWGHNSWSNGHFKKQMHKREHKAHDKAKRKGTAYGSKTFNFHHND